MLSTNSPMNNTRSATQPCRRQHNSSVKRPVRKVPPPLILASASPYRLGQLRQLGLAAEAVPSDVDEAEWKAKRWPARTLALELAIAKAAAVAKRFPDAVVIGGDQIASLEGEPFDKPITLDTARTQLRRLSGKTHELLTAAAFIVRGEVQTFIEPVKMTMRSLSDQEIEDYLAADQPLDCAGCYRWELKGPTLFERVETNDPTAILGLPLLWIAKTLRSLGFKLP